MDPPRVQWQRQRVNLPFSPLKPTPHFPGTSHRYSVVLIRAAIYNLTPRTLIKKYSIPGQKEHNSFQEFSINSSLNLQNPLNAGTHFSAPSSQLIKTTRFWADRSIDLKILTRFRYEVSAEDRQQTASPIRLPIIPLGPVRRKTLLFPATWLRADAGADYTNLCGTRVGLSY